MNSPDGDIPHNKVASPRMISLSNTAAIDHDLDRRLLPVRHQSQTSLLSPYRIQYMDCARRPIFDLRSFKPAQKSLLIGISSSSDTLVAGGGGARTRSRTYRKRGTFQVQLYAMLEEVHKEGNEHIVSWKPHGRAFEIHDRSAFEETIMPRFFNTTKFLSFKRQLGIYCFSRVASGMDKGSYFHECFLRGRPDLVSTICRSSMQERPVSTPVAPNFYELPVCRELSPEEVRAMCSHHLLSESIPIGASSSQASQPTSSLLPMIRGNYLVNFPDGSMNQQYHQNTNNDDNIVAGTSDHDQERDPLNPMRVFGFEGTVGSVGEYVEGPSEEEGSFVIRNSDGKSCR